MRRINLIQERTFPTQTVFLDRDGVINRRLIGNYVTRPQDFEILPGFFEALSLLKKLRLRIYFWNSTIWAVSYLQSIKSKKMKMNVVFLQEHMMLMSLKNMD